MCSSLFTFLPDSGSPFFSPLIRIPALRAAGSELASGARISAGRTHNRREYTPAFGTLFRVFFNFGVAEFAEIFCFFAHNLVINKAALSGGPDFYFMLAFV